MRFPALAPIEPWPLAARLASTPEATPWSLVVAPAERIEALAAEIAAQLRSLLDVEVVSLHVTRPEELFDRVGEHPAEALVIEALDALDAEAWRRVDLGRNRLAHDPPAILVVDERRLRIIVDNAPNLWSWLGGSVWRGKLEGDVLDPAPIEREPR